LSPLSRLRLVLVAAAALVLIEVASELYSTWQWQAAHPGISLQHEDPDIADQAADQFYRAFGKVNANLVYIWQANCTGNSYLRGDGACVAPEPTCAAGSACTAVDRQP
jgi:hypothetical protein